MIWYFFNDAIALLLQIDATWQKKIFFHEHQILEKFYFYKHQKYK